MKIKFFLLILCLFLNGSVLSQASIHYDISFKNAVHHEAQIRIEFKDLEKDTLSLRMSRSSPGRYAIHEFAKNVYRFKATDDKGKELKVTRPNPYQWDISGHQGTVAVSYLLFANHGDGTYSQIDKTHAHLNIPATFMFAPSLEKQQINIKIHPRNDLNWKIATQLKDISNNEYYAPDLAYFMDSPIEISNHEKRSFKINRKGKDYTINFVLHQDDDYAGFDAYFEQVKKIVFAEIDVFGDLPNFDYDTYTFLACYIINVDGDGMEHRNSTVLTSQRSLAKGGSIRNIGTVAHEFFHAWNVERIRPLSLEPFDFTKANMSGELWFAEGFTSYYTKLILCRAGILSRKDFAAGLSKTLNTVLSSPGRTYFNPVEMSYQAPFVDAATSVDQVNWENTFISYYTYGNALGLGLDLSLRQLDNNKTLDGFMKLMWQIYGKTEIPYTLENLQTTLASYVNPSFSENFFNRYIFKSDLPDYKTLLASVGISLSNQYENRAYFGAKIEQIDNKWLINSNPQQDSSMYNAKLSKGDQIISIDGRLTNNRLKPIEFLNSYKGGDQVRVFFNRFGKNYEVEMTFVKDPSFKTSLMSDISKTVRQKQDAWLNVNSK